MDLPLSGHFGHRRWYLMEMNQARPFNICGSLGFVSGTDPVSGTDLVSVCVRACVRAYVRACVRACVCVFPKAIFVFFYFTPL